MANWQDSALNAFQDRVMRVPGIVMPEPYGLEGSYGVFNGKVNPGDEIRSFRGILDSLNPGGNDLVSKVIEHFMNQRRKEFMMITPNAPAGTIAHEASHALLTRALKDKSNKKLLQIPNLGQEHFAYDISDPIGRNDIPTAGVSEAVYNNLNQGTDYQKQLAAKIIQLRNLAAMAKKGQTELNPLR